MASTKYQILYRHKSEHTDQPFLNDGIYEPLLDMHTADHKINVTAAQLSERGYANPTAAEAEKMRISATGAKEEMIAFASSKENPKYNMLFCYAGTKKINHLVFMPQKDGALANLETINIIEDQSVFPTEIGDWNKDFVKLKDSQSPVGYRYVLKPEKYNSYKFYYELTHTQRFSPNDGLVKIYENQEQILNEWFQPKCPLVFKQNPFQNNNGTTNYYTDPWYNTGWGYAKTHLPQDISSCYFFGDPEFKFLIIDFFTNPNNIKSWSEYYTHSGWNSWTEWKTRTGYLLEDFNKAMQGKFQIFNKHWTTLDSVEKFQIPEHYEGTLDTPYFVKDEYKKIEGSPWFVYSTKESLNDALDTAKKLIKILGIECVKVIKYVPTGQFLKIK